MSNERAGRTLDFYLGLSYPVTVHVDPDGGFVAEIEDLPGCMTQAETLEELFLAVEDARCAWLEAAYQSGQDIPLPMEVEEYKGKILVRVPRGLHRDLARLAKREGVSLNQYITTLLASGVRGELLTFQASALLAGWQSSVSQGGLVGFAYFGTQEKPRRRDEIDMLERVKLPTR